MPTYAWTTFPIPAPSTGSTETLSAIQRARASMLSSQAEGRYLTIVGQNYGVARASSYVDDELYRRLIQVLAWLPKQVLSTCHFLCAAVLGAQDALIIEGKRPWRIYEVNANEIIIEVPSALLTADLTAETASYLHGWYGYAAVASGPSATFTTPGDVRTASATTLVGQTLYAYVSGAWVTYTINTVSYSAVTGLSTVTVSAATLPTGGAFFSIAVVGDGTVSYRGDYVTSGGFISTYATAAGPATATTTIVGDVTRDVVVGHPLVVTYGGDTYDRTVVSLTYSEATNLTTLVLSATVPGGLTGETVVKFREVADTASTPDHDDRIYLADVGPFEVIRYYLDLLVRAAGIVVRLEQV